MDVLWVELHCGPSGVVLSNPVRVLFSENSNIVAVCFKILQNILVAIECIELAGLVEEVCHCLGSVLRLIPLASVMELFEEILQVLLLVVC